MNTRIRQKLLVARLLSVVAFSIAALLSPPAHSADIIWSDPTQISGASDVSTTGSLIGAYNVGGVGVPSTTVNGVAFQSFATTGGTGSSGNFTTIGSGFIGQSNNDGGSSAAPFSTLPAAYQTLLQSYSVPFAGTITMTIAGLTIGAQYQFQCWSNVSSDRFSHGLTATAGNSITLFSNDDHAQGGLGEWVIGTFTADAATQSITFEGDGDGGVLNAFQLRRLSQTAAVPETGSTMALLGCALAGLFVAQRRLRARA